MVFGDDSPDQLARQCVRHADDVFGEFYRPLLTEYARQVEEWVETSADPAADVVDASHTVRSLLHSVLGALTATGGRTLIAAFRASPMGYQEFHDWISEGAGRQELLGRFPELARLLQLQSSRHRAHALNVLTAAYEDRHVLAENLGVDGQVTSVTAGLGDPHRGGKTVCFVHWSNGVSAIYKPHTRSCHDLLATLCSLVDEDGSFFGPLLPKTITRPTHLWQERIEHTGVEDEEDLARYFGRFGRVAALLSMLGASDLHHENVIAVAEGPVVIDTETLVQLPVTADLGAAGALARDVSISVLNTLLLPARFVGGRLDFDLSAIGSVQRGESKTLRSYTIVNAGTDDIRFDQIPVTIGASTSMATAQGIQADPLSWVDEITAGFDEARERLRACRSTIEQLVARSDGWAARHMLRPTFVYGRFLEASTHPTYLAGVGDRTELLEKLPPSRRGLVSESSDALHEAEVRALADLDIPYFEVACDSHDVVCNGQSLVAGAVAVSPREAALATIGEFFDRPPGRDLAYIRYALASSVSDVWVSRALPRHNGHRPHGKALSLTDPAGWLSSLRELVVSTDRGVTWLMPQLDGTDRLHLAPANALLHEGGGLLLYLARLESAGHEPLPGAGVADAYAQAVPPELSVTIVPRLVSPFTGTLSSLVTGLELQRCDVAGVELPVASAVAGQVDIDSMSLADFDYLNGFGGYLVYLAEYADQGAPNLVDVKPQQLLARLTEVDGPPDQHAGELGLAHGRFGRIAALSGLVRLDPIGNADVRVYLERFATAYIRHRWTDEALQDEASRSGWCKGYAGVAYALAKLLQAIGYAAGDIRDVLAPDVERIVSGPPNGDVSFCHGMAGRLAMLCWLADRLQWPALRTEAKALHTMFVERYHDGGWCCGIGTLPDLPSFLFGLPGWYYAQRMCEDSSLELPLCLGGG